MSGPYIAKSFAQVCISREFATLALGQTSPVIAWLRALGRDLHAQAGGPGIGAVGMCFSGGFALAMAVDEDLLAPILAEQDAADNLTANGYDDDDDAGPKTIPGSPSADEILKTAPPKR